MWVQNTVQNSWWRLESLLVTPRGQTTVNWTNQKTSSIWDTVIYKSSSLQIAEHSMKLRNITFPSSCDTRASFVFVEVWYLWHLSGNSQTVELSKKSLLWYEMCGTALLGQNLLIAMCIPTALHTKQIWEYIPGKLWKTQNCASAD